MPIDFSGMRECLQNFDFGRLFVEHLGWTRPANKKTVRNTVGNLEFNQRPIAQLAGAVVFEIITIQEGGRIPDAKSRAAIHKEISKSHHENLLIFLDERKTQSLWYWVKRQNGKLFPREHSYTIGQPGDLFLSKLSGIVFEIGDFDKEGNISIVEVAHRLQKALDVERVTKRFYTEYQQQHIKFVELIEGIDNERQKHWYASILFNRLMFVYFLQRKLFLDRGDSDYLQNKLKQAQEKGKIAITKSFLRFCSLKDSPNLRKNVRLKPKWCLEKLSF